MLKSKFMKFFVYGTLRPDITAPWTESVYKNEEFLVKYEKASLPFSRLFIDNEQKYPVTIHDLDKYKENDVVHGFLIHTLKNEENFLTLIDEIEEYPDLYIRKIVKAITEDGNEHEAILYTRPGVELKDIGYNNYKIYLEESGLYGKISY